MIKGQNTERGNTKSFFAVYSPDLAPSDNYLFVSMSHALAEQRFGSYEDVKKWLDESFTVKRENFTVVVFTNCPKCGENV